jgi:hypothetical protein
MYRRDARLDALVGLCLRNLWREKTRADMTPPQMSKTDANPHIYHTTTTISAKYAPLNPSSPLATTPRPLTHPKFSEATPHPDAQIFAEQLKPRDRGVSWGRDARVVASRDVVARVGRS